MTSVLKTFEAEANAVIERIADICGVTEDLVEIGYGKGWYSVAVTIERKAARTYKNTRVAGSGDTLGEAADDAIRAVRFYVNEGTHRTPRGVKPDPDGEASKQRVEQARLRASLISALMTADDMTRENAERKVDEYLARKAAESKNKQT